MVLLVWFICVVVGGTLMVLYPDRTKRVEKGLMRRLRLISKGSYERPPTRLDTRMERVIGFSFIVLAVYGLGDLRLGFVSKAEAVPLSESLPVAEHPPLESAVGKSVREFMDKHHPVGIAVGVIDNETSFVLGFGEVKHGSGQAPDSHTLFEIGSITKSFTGLALADLVSRGELSLDQPVEDVLQGEMKIPASGERRITLQDLSTHVSGLPRLPPGLLLTWRILLPGGSANPYSSFSADDLRNCLADHQLKYPPGEKWEYSNLGVGLLGYALARRTGSTCESMYRSRICGPLGLEDTVITLSADQESRLAPGYSGSTTVSGVRMVERARNWTFQDASAGAGALRSTTADMLQFIAANLNPTSTSLSGAIDLAHRPYCEVSEKTKAGLGWLIVDTPWASDRVFLHDGGTGGYSSVVAFSKADQCAVVVLCNTAEGAVTGLGVELLQEVVKSRSGDTP